MGVKSEIGESLNFFVFLLLLVLGFRTVLKRACFVLRMESYQRLPLPRPETYIFSRVSMIFLVVTPFFSQGGHLKNHKNLLENTGLGGGSGGGGSPTPGCSLFLDMLISIPRGENLHFRTLPPRPRRRLQGTHCVQNPII